MSKAKEVVVEFLKGNGATEDTINQFSKVYDNEVSSMAKDEATKLQEETTAKNAENQTAFAKLAAEASIRN